MAALGPFACSWLLYVVGFTSRIMPRMRHDPKSEKKPKSPVKVPRVGTLSGRGPSAGKNSVRWDSLEPCLISYQITTLNCHFLQVLKAVKGSKWDDDSIDQLLAAADASGDGQLQVEDCMWELSGIPGNTRNTPGSVSTREFKCQGLAPHQLVTEKTTFPLGIGAMRYRIQDTMIEYSLIMVH